MSVSSRPVKTFFCFLIAATFLTACGDSPATVAPTAATNIQPTAQIAPTQAAPTAAPPTTLPPATTADPATSQAATTIAAPATTGAVAQPTVTVSGAASDTVVKAFPPITGAKDLVIDQNAITDLVKKLGIPGAATRLYVSDDLSATLAKNTDTALLNSGWNFALPNATKPQRQSDKTVALYTRTGQPDIYFAITDLPTDPKQLDKINIPGLSQSAAQSVAGQLKGHRSLMIVIVAPGMSQGATIGSQPKK